MPDSTEWRRRPPLRGRFFLILVLILIVIFGARGAISYYVDALWFGSLGYGDVFRRTLTLQWTIFATFFAATFLILYGWFQALRRAYRTDLITGSIFIGDVRLPVERIQTGSQQGMQAVGNRELTDVADQPVSTLDGVDDVTVDQRAHRLHREQRNPLRLSGDLRPGRRRQAGYQRLHQLIHRRRVQRIKRQRDPVAPGTEPGPGLA